MINIVPISSNIGSLGPIGGGPNIPAAGQQKVKSFSDLFQDAVKNLDEMDAVKEQDAYDLAVGNVDNLAQIGIDSVKSEMAVQLMVQIRNKLLDSYSEIMRINI